MIHGDENSVLSKNLLYQRAKSLLSSRTELDWHRAEDHAGESDELPMARPRDPQELLDQSRRTKLRKRSTKESLGGAGGFLAGCGAAGRTGVGTGGVVAATSSPSTRPWKMRVGRTRTRRTRMIIFGSMSGCTRALA